MNWMPHLRSRAQAAVRMRLIRVKLPAFPLSPCLDLTYFYG